MNVEVKEDLGKRLEELAVRRRQPVSDLVEQVLTNYVNSIPDDPLSWIQATQSQLQRVWPCEDFSDWKPPRAV